MGIAKITVKDNGSLRIEGEVTIIDERGNEYSTEGRPIISICRCGLSEKKPFCDGAHKDKFVHKAEAFDFSLKK